MDILLPQIRSLLRMEIDFARDSDICLIPNPGIIPDGAGFTFVGIKDGNVTVSHEIMGGGQEKTLGVEIYIYDPLGRSEDNISDLHGKGRIVSDILRSHIFPESMGAASLSTELAVTLLYTPKGLVIRKGLRFEYEREES